MTYDAMNPAHFPDKAPQNKSSWACRCGTISPIHVTQCGHCGMGKPRDFEGPHPPDISQFEQGLFALIKDYSPEFFEVLTTIAGLHMKKNQDYADKAHRYSNFTYAARVAEPFIDPVDKVFATMIGIKMARMAELIGKGKEPNNESVKDTFDDLVNYCAIWNSWRRSHDEKITGDSRRNQRGVSEGTADENRLGTERAIGSL